jgi:hypothetical protein
MASNPKPNYFVWSVVCRYCHEQQTVHMLPGTLDNAQWLIQTVKCVKCELNFDVLVPDTIIDGPFGRTPPKKGGM